MVLKYDDRPGGVSLLEVTPDQGVVITSWADIRDLHGLQYLKVALRHLQWKRPNKSRDIIEEFIKQTEGAAYEPTLAKKKKSVNLDEGLQEETKEA